MKWWARRAPRSCASIRSPRWRRGCCASSSNSQVAMLPCRRKAMPNRPAATSSALPRLHRPQQDVPLLAERKLDDALWCEVAHREHHLLVGDRDVVDLETPAFDLPARLALGGHQADVNGSVEDAEDGL